MKKLLSVIVPVYNVEDYIEDCLNSLINQTIGISNIEVLIIDDCSPDKSIDVIKNRFSKKHIKNFKIIRHPSNKGLGGARNTGIEKASADYIYFLDSDDVLYPNALKVLYDQITDTKSDIAIGGINNYNEKLEFVSVYQKNKLEVIEDFGAKFLGNKIKMFNVVVWNKLYSINILKNLRFFERMYFEDEPFSLLLNTKVEKVVFVEEPVYKYRRREESITSTNFNQKHLESLKIIYTEGYKILKDNVELFGKWLEEKIRVVFRKFELSNEQKKQYLSVVEEIIQNEPYERLEILGVFEFLKNTIQPYKTNFPQDGYFDRFFKCVDKVTVIIPTYRRPENLKLAIESVVSQTYKNIEVIVIDANDPESEYRQETEKLMNAYPNVIYIKGAHALNGAEARNLGLKYSNSEYISFLDDDDVYLPEKVKKSIEAIKKYPSGYGAVYCGYLGWNSDSNDLRRYKEGDLTYDLLTLQYKNHYLCTNTALYKSYTLKRLSGFDETYTRHQDLELNLRFFQLYKMGVVKEAMVKLKPSQVKTENWLDAYNFYFLKLKYLKKFNKLINSFSFAEQEEIYFQNWQEAAKKFKSITDFISFGAQIDDRSDMYFLRNKRVLLPKSEVDKELIPLQKEKGELDIKLNKYLHDFTRLTTVKNDLERRVDLFVNRTTSLTNEITDYKVRINEVQQLNSALKGGIEKRNNFSENIKNYQLRIAEVQNQNRQLNIQIDNLQSNMDFLRHKLNDADKKHMELDEKLSDLNQQKEWFLATYSHLPKWFLKIGSVFRRFSFKKIN
ncbi:MAG: glycosyltransferase [Bacteroidota bacterium]